jgi:serine/threonine protein kinase
VSIYSEQLIRGYQFGQLIGSGGYGEVYQAIQQSVDREVAIKVILPQYANDPQFVTEFESEAKLIAQLEHLNIVPLIDYWRDEQGAFLVMRYIRGGSLRGMLAKQGALSLTRVLRIAEQVAEALNVAHEAGVVHRDLKPDNILIDERGNAYLTDFGIAKQTNQDDQSATDAIKGTFAYLSPEQIQQTQVSPQTDIYAFGIMLYEMLAGQHPFHETPVGMMIMKHLQESVPDVRLMRDTLDGAIADVIYKATAKDPEERYASTLEMVTELKQAIDGSTSASAPVSQPIIEKKKPTTAEERNRYAMLENVQKFWIEGVLENSLHDTAMIDLGMKPESGAVDNPWDTLIRTPNGEETLTNESIASVFDRMNGKLLILGDPGSGKTTTLLNLARDLLLRAELDKQHPIPVVLNLSSWSEDQLPLTEWLVEELNGKYQVPRKVGKKWVEGEELLLLLDGLDEVAENVRDACVQAINAYRSEHGFVDVVVCSRIKDYESLSGQLKLNGAIVIQPLDDEQIVQYLDGLGADVAIVSNLIARDKQLHELAQSPLMLSIMILAYQGVAADDVPNFDNVESQRQHLFEVYVQRMFERRIGEKSYTKEETQHYLSWLAQKMQEHVQTVFHIEGLQPSWLPKEQQEGWQWYPRLVYAGIFGLLAFITYFLSAPYVGFPPLIGGLAYGLAIFTWGMVYTDFHYSHTVHAHSLFGVMYFIAFYISFAKLGAIGVALASLLGLTSTLNSFYTVKGFIERGNNPNIIRPIDRLTFSLGAINPKYAPILAGFYGGIYVYSVALFGGAESAVPSTLIATILGFLGGSMAIGITFSITSSEAPHRSTPNQGIIISSKNAVRMLPIWLLPTTMLMLPGHLITVNIQAAIGAYLILGLPMLWGFFIAMFGGYATLQHVLLRQLLQREYNIPRNMALFLNHATELILLRKVGGGYIFIHRYLLEYFADLENDKL